MADGGLEKFQMEIPVYFTDEFSKYMHLFQFPNKKKDVQGELSQKVLAKSFKIDMALDDHKHFSHDQAMHLSGGSDEPVKLIRFVSRPLDLSNKFLIGRMKEDGLFLSSLDQISQFYPSLDHLDQIIEKDNINSSKIQDAMDQDNNIIEDAKIVQMSMRTNENADSVKKKENEQFIRKIEEEKWSKVEWSNMGSDGLLDQIFYRTENELQIKIEKDEYLDLISPKFRDDKLFEKVKPGLSLNQLEKFSLKDRITGILMNCHLITIGQLDDALKKSVQITELLKVLPLVAVCIRGIWIIKSGIIYDGRVKDARNFLLYLFQQKEDVERNGFNEVSNLPLEMSKGLFSEIAILGKDRKWKLKINPDPEFVKENQVLIQSQQKIIKENGLAAIELLATRGVKVKKESPVPVFIPMIKREAAVKDEQLDAAIREILAKHQVGNLQFILQGLNEIKNKKGNEEMFKTLTKELVVQSLERLCFSLRGIFILKELGDSKFFEVRSKVVDCFRRKKTVSIGNVRTKIRGASDTEPTKDELIEILNTFSTADGEDNWTIRDFPVE